MPLQPDQKPGVWTNSDWAAGTAGTFAVVVGVSKYRYLRDGEGDDGHGQNLAPENYDLGQLPVSALTATHFFEWLRDRYRMTGAPMAKCWLLLAPNDDEVRVYKKALPHSAEPTLAACQRAIGEWYAAARDLPAAAAEASRMLFFFSGHGVQLFRDRQLLLPCDYLAPPLYAANQAISTSNLSIALESLPPKHQFFFIDACRTDHERLRAIPGLEGLKILDERLSRLSSTELVGPIFYATGSGSVALSPAAAKDGISYFGQAVLEAFQAKGKFRPDCDRRLCRVMVHKLGPFLQNRVSALIPTRGSEASVVMGGVVREGVITELRKTRGVEPVTPGHPPPELIQVELPSDNWQPGGNARAILGNEFATALFLDAEAVPLRGRADDAPSKPVIHRLDRTPDKAVYRVDLSVPQPGGYWLQFVDIMRGTSRTYACVLPGDGAYEPRYRLDWSWEDRGHIGYITRLEAKLSPANEGALKEAAALWELYQASDFGGTLKSSDLQTLEERLRQKVASPLAAVIAGTILLRLREHERLHNWLANLADWFDYLPDGPVLCAEQMLQTREDAIESPEFIKRVLQLTRRGLPYTSEALGYADQHVRRLLQEESPTPAQRKDLEGLGDRIQRALPYFRSGGLFAVFMGDSAAVTADLIAPRAADERTR